MLPGISGYEFARNMRQQGITTPVIFLTALSTEDHLMQGFESGADDYIPKPFSINEVLARIKAVLRRTSPEKKQLVRGPLCADLQRGLVTLEGVPVSLSRKEYDLLLLLMRNPGVCYSRAELIRQLWKDSPYVLERTVDVHITRIRSKLGAHRDLVRNRAGFGYYMESDGESTSERYEV